MTHPEDRLTAITRVGRALADPTRCRILLAILDGVRYPAELAEHLGLTRGNVSNHLSCLRGCGLVSTTHEGRQVRYALSSLELVHALGDLLGVVLLVEENDGCAVTAPSLSGSDRTRGVTIGAGV